MAEVEYLVSYGLAGDFSRFRSLAPLALRRGDRVVVRGPRGVELGVVMCPTTPDHLRFLSATGTGDLLRPATAEDERAQAQGELQSHYLFQEARSIAASLQLPIEILDVEVLYDGRQAVVHHLRQRDCDPSALLQSLRSKCGMDIALENMALPVEAAAEHGCGRPDCGQAGGGGCSSCSPAGGCSVEGCGKAVAKEDVAHYLTALRARSEK